MASLLQLKRGVFTPAPTARLLKAADYALLLEAESILDAARAEAEALRQQAVADCALEKERAYAQGMAEGKMEMAERMFSTISASVDYLENMETMVVELVMKALRKIIDDMDDRERVQSVVRKALGYVRSQKRVLLRISPEDAELLRDWLADLHKEFAGIGVLDTAVDPHLSRGDCILESELGLIDASLDVQLAGIRKAFANQVRQGESPAASRP